MRLGVRRVAGAFGRIGEGGDMIIAGRGPARGGKAQIRGVAVTLDEGERGNTHEGERAGPSP